MISHPLVRVEWSIYRLSFIISLLEECVQDARLGTGGESRWLPASIEQVERKALNELSVHLDVPWAGDSREPRAKRNPLRALDHLGSDFLLFSRGCIQIPE